MVDQDSTDQSLWQHQQFKINTQVQPPPRETYQKSLVQIFNPLEKEIEKGITYGKI